MRGIPIWTLTFVLATVAPAPAGAQGSKPNVAILVYDGVQVDDHAIPFEVFSQFALNEVYTVAKGVGELTTWRGMRILPNYTFADAPEPDVLVLPGGDAGDARADPEIMAWVRRTAASADYVLTICTGTFFLVGTDLLHGARVTTWYDRQDELRQAAPEAEVVGDEIVVESGKLVTAAGSGIEGSLLVVAKLHGEAWSEVVRLNLEYEPIPAELHVPRVELADLKLPDGLYGEFPWRRAELALYEGDRNGWRMRWRFTSDAPFDSLSGRFAHTLAAEDGWELRDQESSDRLWASRWNLPGHEGSPWRGAVSLGVAGKDYDLDIRVRRAGEPCESVDPAWSPDGGWIYFVSSCEGDPDIFRMRPDGTGVERLTARPGREHEPVFSPDRSMIAYAYRAEGDSEIHVMAADGTGDRAVTDDEFSESTPTWSPDGTRIAYESRRNDNGDVYVLELESGRETRLTRDPSDDLAPAWSPDGSTIAFQTNREGHWSIYGVDVHSGSERPLEALPAHAVSPAWSPDGGHIAFSYRVGERAAIYVVAVEGGEPVPLAGGDRTDFAPAWSPDGQRIAFISRRAGGAWDIWTVDADGANETQLTFGGEAATGPED